MCNQKNTMDQEKERAVFLSEGPKEREQEVLDLCNIAFRRWGEKVKACDKNSTNDKYHLYLLPHANAKNLGFGNITYKVKDVWNYKEYVTSSRKASFPIRLCTGDVPQLLLPDSEDGATLRTYGLCIQLKHRDIRTGPYKIMGMKVPLPKPENAYFGKHFDHGGDWFESRSYDSDSHESVFGSHIFGVIDYNPEDFYYESYRMEEFIDYYTNNLTALTEYAKDVYGIERKINKRKREREE